MIGSIFNIGSNHNQLEVNNTIAKLGKSARNRDGAAGQVTAINDGPPTTFPEKHLRDRRDAMIQWLKDNNVTHLNMTGHSRGAYLCNMIVKGVAKDATLRGQIQEINVINLDPVKRAALDNCTISEQRKVMRYHLIIMLHEQSNEVILHKSSPRISHSLDTLRCVIKCSASSSY